MFNLQEFARALLPVGAGTEATAQIAHQLNTSAPEAKAAVMQHVGQAVAMNDAAAGMGPQSGFGYTSPPAVAPVNNVMPMPAMADSAPVIAPPQMPVQIALPPSTGGQGPAPLAAPAATASDTAGIHTGAPATQAPKPGDPGQPDFQNVTLLGPGDPVPVNDDGSNAAHMQQDRDQANQLAVDSDASAHRQKLQLEQSLLAQTNANNIESEAKQKVNDQQELIRMDQIDQMRQTQDALKQLDNYEQQAYMGIKTRQTQIADQQFQMAQEHPENVWGNANLGQKVAGLIGIVGAGLAGQDCTQRVMQMAAQAVNAQKQRADILQGAAASNNNLFDISQKAFGSHEMALKNLQANYLGIVAARMEQAAAQSQNDLTKANYMRQNGMLLQQKAALDMQVEKGAMANTMGALNAKLHLDTIESQRITAAQAANAKLGTARMKWAEGQTQSRIGSIVDPAEHKVFAKVEAGGFGLIRGLDRVEILGRQLENAVNVFGKDSESAVAIRARYIAERDGLIKDWRSFTESGARIDPAEQKNYDTMVPTWLESTLIGDWGGEYDRIHEARDMIVRSIRDSGDSVGSGTSRFNGDLPLFAPSVKRDIDHREYKHFDYTKASPEEQQMATQNRIRYEARKKEEDRLRSEDEDNRKHNRLGHAAMMMGH